MKKLLVLCLGLMATVAFANEGKVETNAAAPAAHGKKVKKGAKPAPTEAPAADTAAPATAPHDANHK